MTIDLGVQQMQAFHFCNTEVSQGRENDILKCMFTNKDFAMKKIALLVELEIPRLSIKRRFESRTKGFFYSVLVLCKKKETKTL